MHRTHINNSSYIPIIIIEKLPDNDLLIQVPSVYASVYTTREWITRGITKLYWHVANGKWKAYLAFKDANCAIKFKLMETNVI